MRSVHGKGKIEDRPTPQTTWGYRHPLLDRILGSELGIALIVAFGLFVLISVTSSCFGPKCEPPFWEEYRNASYGAVLDILVTGFVVLALNQRAQRKRDSVEYQEQIDSLRRWPDPEAGVRILHNIRRLNRNGITSIFLSGSHFDGLDFRSDGEAWGTTKIADLGGSYAPGASFKEAVLTGVSLRDANLQGCDFSGAWCGSADFSGALLLGANFTGAVLTWADLSRAKHLLPEQLARAKNLHGAKMSVHLRERVSAINPKLFDREPFESSMPEFLKQLDWEQLAKEFQQAQQKERGEKES